MTTPPETDEVSRAVAWLHTARFRTTASRLSELPVSELREIAFVGRSNAGKSSAINALTGQRRLAFSSKTPGRTQHINLFDVGPKDEPNALLADLPGYGYAAVERTAKVRWQDVMARYLEIRRNLETIVLLVDSRLGLTDNDRILLDFIKPRVHSGSVSLMLLLTKADKLNRRQLDLVTAQVSSDLEHYASESSQLFVAPFSALRGTGVGDVAALLATRRLPEAG